MAYTMREGEPGRWEVSEMAGEVRFTVSDLALVPEDGNRYENIDGELCASPQPHRRDQFARGRLLRALDTWSGQGNTGPAIEAPGVIFAGDDAVAPDLVWKSRLRYADGRSGLSNRYPQSAPEPWPLGGCK